MGGDDALHGSRASRSAHNDVCRAWCNRCEVRVVIRVSIFVCIRTGRTEATDMGVRVRFVCVFYRRRARK